MRRSLAVLLLAGAGPAMGQTTPEARLDSLFVRYRSTHGPGCAVAVSRNGEVLAAKGYGMADLAQGISITPNSVFHIASVSKQFTAMSLVLLAASGKVSLDDDIRKYLPELPDYGQPITIRHMLNHTGGLRDQWNLLMTAGWRLGDDLITDGDVLEIVSRQRGLNFAPGTDWLYSNTGFTLAAIIVKRVTGRSLREYAEEAIFRPLGMTRTHFHDDNSMVVPGRTRGHSMRDSTWKEMVPNYSTVGATSLFTTVLDLARWHGQLDEPTVVGKAALATLLARPVLASGDTLRYALGISHGSYRGQPTLSHGGGDPGYRTHFLHFPGLRAGVTVFCNLNEVNPARLAEQTADAFFGAELWPVEQTGDSLAGGPLATSTGLYWSEQTETAARVKVENGRLLWQVGPNGVPLWRLSERSYRLGQGPAVLEVRQSGEVRLVSSNGEPSLFLRVEAWTGTPADRAALAGRYRSDEIGVAWELRSTGDSLTLVRRKFSPVRLDPVMKDTYVASSGLPFLIRAVREKGRVTKITVGSGRVRRMQFVRAVDATADED